MAQAANLLVSNTNDSGAGSLRQAILDNSALGGDNTILFSNVVTGTITLTTGELVISNDVTILGPGANAHGPNEFLHVPTAKRLTGCVAQVLEAHAAR